MLLVAVLLVGLAGAAAVLRPGPVAGWLGADPTPSAAAPPPEPDPSPVLAGPDAAGPRADPAGVRAAVEPLTGAAALGSRVNVSVADVVTGESLYAKGGDDGTVPASVTKLRDRGDRAGGAWPRLPDPDPRASPARTRARSCWSAAATRRWR